MNKDSLRQAAVVVSVLGALTVNILANALPINGQSTGEISDRFEVYFTPAGYVFSIWGVIFIGWLLLAVYQALPAQRENPRLRKIGYPFALSGLFNAGWLVLWHYNQFPATLAVMLVLLALLIVVYLRMEPRNPQVPAAEKWLVQLPVRVYLGWITVATIANLTALLDYLQWNGWGLRPEIWLVVVLSAALLVALAMARTQKDVAYLLVLVWSFVGIWVKHRAVPTVGAAALSAAVAVALLALSSLVSRLRAARRA
ncbi:MAG: tryptophan-rich sensory protein [Chloroflexi bacterium]|nr:tryptophan-rich sensory protein [Chloroflexota bacterium]